MNIEIYTDGSSINQRYAGCSAIINVIENDCVVKTIECSDAFNGTNNLAEIRAIVKALTVLKAVLGLKTVRDLEKIDYLNVHTDSQYVSEGFNNWINNWSKNGWRTKNGLQIANKNIWEQMFKIKNCFKNKMSVEWIKAHNNNPFNELADELAKKAAKEYKEKQEART